MASNSVSYFLKEDIEAELKCLSCKTQFDIPKFLPCSCSICSKCEQKLLSKTSSGKIECPICMEEHDLPSKNGFPVNKLIQKLLNKAPRVVDRGELHENALKQVNEMEKITEKFCSEMKNTDSVITAYCDLVRNNVDIKTESIISIINTHRDNLIKEISNYEKKALNSAKNVNEFERFVSDCKNRYAKWLNYLQQAYLVDTKIKEIINEVDLLKKEFQKYSQTFELHIFGENKLKFTESDCKIEKTIIGYLNQFSPINAIKALKDQKSVSYIDYMTHNTMNMINVLAIDVMNENICVIAPTIFDGFSTRTSDKIVLKLFSVDGCLLKEINEPQNMICAVKFGQYIVVAYENSQFTQHSQHFRSSSIKIYDGNLYLVKSIDIDHEAKGIYSNNSEIIVHAIKNNAYFLLSYDEKLKLLKSKSLKQHNIFSSGQIFIRFHKIYSFSNGTLTIYDLDSLLLLETIRFEDFNVSSPMHAPSPRNQYNHSMFQNQQIFTSANAMSNRNDFLFQVISPNTFILLGRNDHMLRVYNSKKECLVEFKINCVSSISSFFLTDTGNLVINDRNSSKLTVIREATTTTSVKTATAMAVRINI